MFQLGTTSIKKATQSFFNETHSQKEIIQDLSQPSLDVGSDIKKAAERIKDSTAEMFYDEASSIKKQTKSFLHEAPLPQDPPKPTFILMLISDAPLDFEVTIPFFTFEMLAYKVEVASQGRSEGDLIRTWAGRHRGTNQDNQDLLEEDQGPVLVLSKDQNQVGHEFRVTRSWSQVLEGVEVSEEDEDEFPYDGLVVCGPQYQDPIP